ncbi:MAG TPA: ABC transporter permease [Steroidobacteraceae bacterium]|jgi:phospholipid/cholesterol/gamma-HCH transport system permease protein|nr:ABC transporter permease [Steroidobacteraceae bacterium]
MVLEVRTTEQGLALDLTGEWRALAYGQIDSALAAVDLGRARHIEIATARLTALDLTGAWRLREFVLQAQKLGAQVTFAGTPPDQMRLVDETLRPIEAAAAAAPRPVKDLRMELEELPVEAEVATLTFIGRRTVTLWRDMSGALAFLGRVSVTGLAGLPHPRRLRPTSIARHVYDTGITAIPIVALIAFLISVIVAYMSAQQLRSYGAEIFVVDLVTIGVLRELGVLLTAIIVAGRSGSAFAAEIGSMKLNEEVDALQATGVDPFEALVVPRVIGLVISLPLLTVIADMVGLLGGAVLCASLLHIPLDQYITRVSQAISPTTFWVGIIKAPVFAALIALAGTHRGMQVSGSSRELGRLTTVAVVQAIFLVILADALFAVLFLEIGV